MSTPARLLIAEDDRPIREGLVDALESEGYETTATADGPACLAAWRDGGADLVILDIMMPGKSGYEVCREIRAADPRTPILMLTAKGEEIDKVVGLELGADDYMTKPFGVKEFLARVHALLRRASLDAARKEPDKSPFPFGPCAIDPKTYTGTRGKDTFDLSPREMDLLRVFASRPGEVLSRDELLNQVWGMNYYGTTRTLDQHIAQLRKKIEPDRNTPTVILTVHGLGYKYQA